MEQIQEMNKIIGIFDGLEFIAGNKKGSCDKHRYNLPDEKCTCYEQYDHFYDKQGKRLFDLQYHSSWDAIKPIIDKIYTYALAYPEQVNIIRKMSIVVEIKAAHQRCYDFIIWYNQQPK